MKNNLTTTGDIVLLSGASYTLLSNEVGVNGVAYNKSGLIAIIEGNETQAVTDNVLAGLSDESLSKALVQVKIGIKRTSGVRNFPAKLSKYADWTIDGTVQTSVVSCIENVRASLLGNIVGAIHFSITKSNESTSSDLDGRYTAIVPEYLDGARVHSMIASVVVPSSGGVTVDVNINRKNGILTAPFFVNDMVLPDGGDFIESVDVEAGGAGVVSKGDLLYPYVKVNGVGTSPKGMAIAITFKN